MILLNFMFIFCPTTLSALEKNNEKMLKLEKSNSGVLKDPTKTNKIELTNNTPSSTVNLEFIHFEDATSVYVNIDPQDSKVLTLFKPYEMAKNNFSDFYVYDGDTTADNNFIGT